MEKVSVIMDAGSVDAAGVNDKKFETRIFSKGCLGVTTLSPIELLFSGRLVDGCCGVRFYEGGCFMPLQQDVIIAGVYEGDTLRKVAWIRPAKLESSTGNVGGNLIEAVDQPLASTTLLGASAEGIDFSSRVNMSALS